MNISEILEQKQNGLSLTKEEISFIILSYYQGKLNEAKMLDFLRLIDENNFSYEETFFLADALAKTGRRLDIQKDVGFVIDKHSAGEFSDASTLIFMSVLASLGVKNVKSLSDVYGSFNNSLDRLRLFDGFDARISRDRLVQIINKTNAGVIEEDDFALVDKKLYILAKKFNINSIPFTAASILAKKIATGASALVFDVKTGEGAMFQSEIYAETLAKYLVESAKLAGFLVSSVISNLDQPLGSSVGLRVEVEEALSVIRCEKSLYASKLLDVSKELVINALILSDPTILRPDAARLFDDAINSGTALNKFREIISEYGGEFVDFKHTPEKLLDGIHVSYLSANKSGYVNDIVISRVFNAYMNLAFRNGKLKDENAGIVLMVGEGDKISEGDKIARIFYHIDNKNFSESVTMLKKAFRISQSKPQQRKILYKVII